METIGTMIADARKARHLLMKDLVPQLLKEDGEPISLSYLGLIEQDRCKPSPGLIPQLAEVLGIPEDALYAALGLLPPDIKALVSQASTQQALDAFRVMRKIFSSGDES